EVIHQERYQHFIRNRAWQAITSAAHDEKALDVLAGRPIGERDEASHHSPFALALLQALRRDRTPTALRPPGALGNGGVITATALYLHLLDAFVTGEDGQSQTPGIWPLSRENKGEYVFLVPGHPLNLPPAPELNAANNP